jgi:tetratricopeptide (TPR) repeat protein
MYLKPRPRRRRRGFPLGRLLGITLLSLMIAGVWYTYQHRDSVLPMVENLVGTLSSNVNDTVATIAAPTPTPTEDPSREIRLAEAAWNTGSYQEAVRLYQNVIRALPNDVKAHYYLTLGLIMQGRLSEAVEAAENTVTANPFSSDAWAIRAMALNRVGRYGDSIVSALRAIELDPNSARARAFLAESYLDNGQPARADSELTRALELNPDSYEAYYVLGLYHWDSTYNFAAAREAMQNAYDLSGGAAHIGLNLARLQATVFQDLPGATALLKDILNRNPDNGPILYQLGVWEWRNNGNSQAAEPYLRRCVTATPDDLFCQYELGRVLVNLGQVAEARPAFERVIELGSTNPYHYFWAGQAQIQTSADCGAAMRYWIPGLQTARAEVQAGSTRYNSVAALEQLISDFGDVMAQCGGAPGVPLETPTPTEEGA